MLDDSNRIYAIVPNLNYRTPEEQLEDLKFKNALANIKLGQTPYPEHIICSSLITNVLARKYATFK
jgi:hypothetical protein